MDQQLTDLLEILKNGLKQIPEIGSEGWEMYVRGYQLSHVLTVAGCILGILVCLAIILKWKQKDDGDVYDAETRGLTIYFLYIVSIGLAVYGFTNLYGVLLPEFSIIKELMGRIL